MSADRAQRPSTPSVDGILVIAGDPAAARLLQTELELSGYGGQVTACTVAPGVPANSESGMRAVVVTGPTDSACAALETHCGELPAQVARLRFVAEADPQLQPSAGLEPASGQDLGAAPAGTAHANLSSLLLDLAQHIAPTRRPATATPGAAGDAEQKYRDLFEQASDAILIVDLGTLQVLAANQRVRDIYGYEPEQMVGMSLLDLAPRDEHLSMARNIERITAGSGGLRIERRTQIRRDGTHIEVTISTGLLAYEGFAALQGVIRDETRRLALETELVETNALLEREVIQRREAESKATYLALHDELTGLANRRLFFAHLDQALTVSARTRQPFAVVFLDLDGLKPVNDEIGHHAGDLLLITAAARFRECMRAADTLARLAGDEFGMLLRGMDSIEHCEAFAEKVLSTLRVPLDIEGHSVLPSASLGFAMYPTHGDHAAPLVRLADEAMYEAKRAGKGTYRSAEGAEARSLRRRGGARRGAA